MKKLYIFTFLILIYSFGLFAQIPNGYYKNAEGKKGYELKSALFNIIKNGYKTQSYGALYTAYVDGDTDPEDGFVWDIYSENPSGKDPYNYSHSSGDRCGSYSSEGDCYNREHIMPQSVFSEQSPMVSDFHHIFPTDGKVNGMRSNYPFGEVGSPSWTSRNGSKLGTCSSDGYSGKVFEPINEFKGDVARALLYFATRYEDQVAGWNHEMLNGTSNQVFSNWFLKVLLKWHNQDPVSQKEITRNNAGYKHQNNRNPFVDHPEYVCLIWSSNCTNSIDEINVDRKQLFTINNPVNDNLVLQTTNEFTGDFQIYSIDGVLLKNENFSCSNEYTINVSELKSGYYIIRIQNRNISEIIPFIKK